MTSQSGCSLQKGWTITKIFAVNLSKYSASSYPYLMYLIKQIRLNPLQNPQLLKVEDIPLSLLTLKKHTCSVLYPSSSLFLCCILNPPRHFSPLLCVFIAQHHITVRFFHFKHTPKQTHTVLLLHHQSVLRLSSVKSTSAVVGQRENQWVPALIVLLLTVSIWTTLLGWGWIVSVKIKEQPHMKPK